MDGQYQGDGGRLCADRAVRRRSVSRRMGPRSPLLGRPVGADGRGPSPRSWGSYSPCGGSCSTCCSPSQRGSRLAEIGSWHGSRKPTMRPWTVPPPWTLGTRRACVRITESDDTHAPYRGAAFRNVRQLPNSDGGSILSFVTPDPANTLVGPTFRMCRAPRRQDRHRTVGRVGTFRRLACVAIQRTFPASLAGLRRESSRRFPRAV